MQEFPLPILCTIFSTQDVSMKDLGRPGLDGRAGGQPRGATARRTARAGVM